MKKPTWFKVLKLFDECTLDLVPQTGLQTVLQSTGRNIRRRNSIPDGHMVYGRAPEVPPQCHKFVHVANLRHASQPLLGTDGLHSAITLEGDQCGVWVEHQVGATLGPFRVDGENEREEATALAQRPVLNHRAQSLIDSGFTNHLPPPRQSRAVYWIERVVAVSSGLSPVWERDVSGAAAGCLRKVNGLRCVQPFHRHHRFRDGVHGANVGFGECLLHGIG